MSNLVLGTELANIREALLIHDAMRVVRRLTHMSEVQRRLFETLGLGAYAPPQPTTVPLQTASG